MIYGCKNLQPLSQYNTQERRNLNVIDITNEKQNGFQLAFLMRELSAGHIAVLDTENKIFLGQLAAKYAQMSVNQFTLDQRNNLKILVMICNVLYNRTDMQVLPVEDGVYDLLMETYKKIDPHFQVGSVVVQFKDKVDKEMESVGDEKKVQPIYFIPDPPKDDIRTDYRNQIKSFDQHRMDFYDVLAYERAKNYTGGVQIGKRTHDTKHNHPDLIGTLDKCKYVLDSDAIEKDVYDKDNVSILERDFFVKHINEGIITPNQELDMDIELKYDGISVEADCTDHIISARTRGDTGIGEAADLTPILEGYEFPHNQALKDRVVGVKFEAIITKSALEQFNRERGYNYANCRTAIIGLFGGSDSREFQKYITLVPLGLDRHDVPEIRNRQEEIGVLNSCYYSKGEKLRHVFIHGNYKTCLYLIKKFAEEAKYARNYLDFAFDGIVVNYLDENIRAKLGRKNFINKYSMAVKFDPLEKITTFLGYTYEVGQTGNICPMIHYSPVEFNGTIHDKSSGQSLQRFKDLDLKIGDAILVTYTNDVMPYVNKLDCAANDANHKQGPSEKFIVCCPICGTPLVISDSGKTASCPNVNCDGRRIARAVNMLQKLNIKGFAESMLTKANLFTLTDMINVREDALAPIIGPTNASNFTNSIQTLLQTPTEDYRWIGSLGFTGVAAKKWKIVFSALTLKEFVELMDHHSIEEADKVLLEIPGLGMAAIHTILTEYEFYKTDIHTILEKANIIDSKFIKTKKSIRFTGCRNHQLEELLKQQGYDADGNGSVTKNTDILIIPYDGFTSTKTNKIGPNTIVVPINEFEANMGKYL